MSEKYPSPRQKAGRRFVAAGMLGGSLLLGTHLAGQQLVDHYKDEPAVTATGAPSMHEQMKSLLGDVEIGEILLDLGVMGMYGARALQEGAFPKARAKYEAAQRTVQSRTHTVDASVSGTIQHLGDTIILAGQGDIDEVSRLMGWGMHPDCSPEQSQEIMQLLQARLQNGPAQN